MAGGGCRPSSWRSRGRKSLLNAFAWFLDFDRAQYRRGCALNSSQRLRQCGAITSIEVDVVAGRIGDVESNRLSNYESDRFRFELTRITRRMPLPVQRRGAALMSLGVRQGNGAPDAREGGTAAHVVELEPIIKSGCFTHMEGRVGAAQDVKVMHGDDDAIVACAMSMGARCPEDGAERLQVEWLALSEAALRFAN